MQHAMVLILFLLGPEQQHGNVALLGRCWTTRQHLQKVLLSRPLLAAPSAAMGCI